MRIVDYDSETLSKLEVDATVVYKSVKNVHRRVVMTDHLGKQNGKKDKIAFSI